MRVGGRLRRPLEIPELAAAGVAAVGALYRATRDARRRARARIVLLAGERRRAAPAIARIVREGEQPVRRRLKRDRAEGRDGPKDRPLPGAPGKVAAAGREAPLAAGRRRPRRLGQPCSLWALRRLAAYLAEQAGRRVSYETVRRPLAAAEVALSRPRHAASGPDPEYAVKKGRSKRPATA